MRTASEIMAAAQPAPVGEPVGWRARLEGSPWTPVTEWGQPGNPLEWKQRGADVQWLYDHAAPTPAITDEMVEAGARCMAFERGYDPDEPAAHHLICGPNNETLPIWRWYAESMRAALTAALRSSTTP